MHGSFLQSEVDDPKAEGFAEGSKQPAMRLIHVASNIAPASGSTFTMIPRLCHWLRNSGLEVELVSADEDPTVAGSPASDAFPVRRFAKGQWGAAIGQSGQLVAELHQLSRRADVVHVHGMWRRSGITALRIARQNALPAVFSPMGSFAREALRNSALRKRAFWHLLQRPSMCGVASFHATSLPELDAMRSFGIRAPIAVVPLGVDIPIVAPPAVSSSSERTLIYLGRISPIKNLPMLVRAWLLIQNRYPNARLRIVGPDDRGHAAQISRLARDWGARRVLVEPGAWGEARDAAILASHALILPSLSESFGLVVAESLAMGRPVIATTGTPWEILPEVGCGWHVAPTPTAIAQAISTMLDLPAATLAEMGERARRLAMRQLCWSRALPQFLRLYDWVLRGGDPPEFVSV